MLRFKSRSHIFQQMQIEGVVIQTTTDFVWCLSSTSQGGICAKQTPHSVSALLFTGVILSHAADEHHDDAMNHRPQINHEQPCLRCTHLSGSKLALNLPVLANIGHIPRLMSDCAYTAQNTRHEASARTRTRRGYVYVLCSAHRHDTPINHQSLHMAGTVHGQPLQ